jgi:hypothetical protein
VPAGRGLAHRLHRLNRRTGRAARRRGCGAHQS